MAVTPVTNNVSWEWVVDDEVVRLREWGTDQIYPLFVDVRGERTIGTASGSWIQLRDPKRRVSRKHAHIERIRKRWYVVDDGSTNGTFLDGARCDEAPLVPCAEIGLGGGATVIAESARSIALREVLARMLGWAPEQAETIDLALRAVRLAATRRTFLVLYGNQELIPLAEELHRLTFTNTRPFVLCHPTRLASDPQEVTSRCVKTGLEALAAAPGGTVCLLHRYLPADLIQLLRELRVPECLTQLVVCSPTGYDAQVFSPTPIEIPSMEARQAELTRLVEEYCADAATVLGLRDFRLSPGAHAWVCTRAAGSLAELQRATLRLAAVHKAGNITAASRLVGFSHVGLHKWFRAREYPRDLAPALTVYDGERLAEAEIDSDSEPE